MKSFLNWFSAIFASFFFIPTILILASWNAVPGDALYGLKIALEDVALVLTRRTALASTLSVKYTERRFGEANTLLSKKGSTAGYSLLVEETKQSSALVTTKKDSKRAAELVTKIEEYQKDIEEKQNQISQGTLKVPTKTASQTPTKTDGPSPTFEPTTPGQPTEVVNTPKPTPFKVNQAESEEEVIQDLENTKNELEQVKEEIKINLPESASDTARDKVEEINNAPEENPGAKNRGQGNKPEIDD